jgi:hypothetical protein
MNGTGLVLTGVPPETASERVFSEAVDGDSTVLDKTNLLEGVPRLGNKARG